jgi:threonine dehydrogenase-like Zn-dependent dehydrogenase
VAPGGSIVEVVFSEGGNLRTGRRDTPTLAAGQVLVRALATGICGSDLRLRDAQREGRAGIAYLGHEFLAEVIDTGPDTAPAAPVGSRVTSIPALLEDDDLRWFGEDEMSLGSLSEFFVLSARLLVPVSPSVPSTSAILIEPTAVALHAIEVVRPVPGDTVLVIGCGPLGLILVALLAKFTRVVASDPHPERRRLAISVGAARVVDPNVEDVLEAWSAERGLAGSSWSGAAGLPAARSTPRPIVFECAGRPAVLSRLIGMVPRGTHIVALGRHEGTDAFDVRVAIDKHLTVDFVIVYNMRDFETAARVMSDGGIPAHDIVTTIVPRSGMVAAFASLDSATTAGKVVVLGS